MSLLRRIRNWTYIEWMVVVLVASLIAVFPAAYYTARAECRTYASELGVRHRFGFIGGCRIELEGRFVPLKIVREGDL